LSDGIVFAASEILNYNPHIFGGDAPQFLFLFFSELLGNFAAIELLNPS
jgi:hypothetical protein